jgi:outer membrane protein assembly factor BamB
MSLLLAMALGAAAPSLSALPPAPLELYRIAWHKPLVSPTLLEWKPQEPAGPAVDPVSGKLVVGTRDGFLRAFKPDGSPLWDFRADGPFDAPPLVDRGVVYAGSDDGRIYALDLGKGTELWRYDAHEEVGTTPVIANGTLYVSTLQDTLLAIDAGSGTWKWQHRREGSGQFTIRGAAGPAIAGGVVYVGYSDGWVAALDASSGVARWERKLAPSGDFVDVDSTPAISNGRIFVAAYSGAVVAAEAASGKSVWEAKLTGASRVKLAGGTLVAVGTSEVVALDPKDGHVIWKQPFDGTPGGTPAVTGRYLLLPKTAGLAWMDLATGTSLRILDPGTGITGTPAVLGRRAYVLSNGGDLLALDLP